MLYERRKKFTSDLWGQLLEVGLVLESVELARGDDGAPVWFVLVTHPRQGLQRYQAALSSNEDPYEEGVPSELARRIGAKLAK